MGEHDPVPGEILLGEPVYRDSRPVPEADEPETGRLETVGRDHEDHGPVAGVGVSGACQRRKQGNRLEISIYGLVTSDGGVSTSLESPLCCQCASTALFGVAPFHSNSHPSFLNFYSLGFGR